MDAGAAWSGGWSEELQGDAVRVAERESGPVGSVDDLAVCDPELVQPDAPLLEPGTVAAGERDVVEPGGTLVERRRARLGVNVQTSLYAEAADVLALQPDEIIIATGSQPRLDGQQTAAPGLVVTGIGQAHVRSSHEIFDLAPGQIGDSAVVLDDVGHYEAIAVAEHLVQRGLDVSFVTRHISFAPQMEGPARSGPALSRLARGRFNVHLRSLLTRIGAKHCEIRGIETNRTTELPADTVVLVTHNQPLDNLYFDLAGAAPPSHIRVIGDARSPRDLLVAMREGHFAARSLCVTAHN